MSIEIADVLVSTEPEGSTWWHDLPDPSDRKLSQEPLILKIKAYVEVARQRRQPILQNTTLRQILMSVGSFYRMTPDQVMSWFQKMSEYNKDTVTETEIKSFLSKAEETVLRELEELMDQEEFRQKRVIRLRKDVFGDRPESEHNCRQFILQAYRGSLPPDGALSVLQKLHYFYDGNVPITLEIVCIWYRRFRREGDDLRLGTPLETLLLESKQREEESAANRKDMLKDVFSRLAAMREKVVERLEIQTKEGRIMLKAQLDSFTDAIVFENIGEDMCSIFRVSDGSCCLTDDGDCWTVALIDILTFLELATEQNCFIRELIFSIEKSSKAKELLELLLSHEAIGKIKVDIVQIWNHGALVAECLKLGTIFKCKILKVITKGFEYGGADKLAKAMRCCNKSLIMVEIETDEEPPHYLYSWGRFDNFAVDFWKKIVVFTRDGYQATKRLM